MDIYMAAVTVGLGCCWHSNLLQTVQLDVHAIPWWKLVHERVPVCFMN